MTARSLIDRIVQQENLNFLLTNRIPRRWLTLFVGWLSRIEQPWLCATCIALWRLFSDLDLSDAKCSRFDSLRDCFTRELKEGARPIDPARMLKEAGADVFSPHWGAMDPQLVKDVHAAGGAVGVWPVDDDQAVAWCKYCKPDSVFTNRPREIGPAFKA